MKMKMARTLIATISLGAVFAGGFSQGEQPPEGSGPRNRGAEPGKTSNDAGKKAAGSYDAEDGLPPKALARKRDVRPGRPRLKLAHPTPLHAEVKKLPGDHAPTIAGPGSGVVLPQKPKAAPQAAKPQFEMPKIDRRQGQTASAAGSNALNGTSMSGLRHGGAGLASIGGITASTARGAAAVNGTEIKPKP
jgi:hypothetical protein